MIAQSIPTDLFNKLIIDAVSKTYSFNSGLFRNESDFKLELYHNLAVSEVNGVSLSSLISDSNTCYLHAEGKCENGNPAKADLLICNSFKFQRFNYQVDYIVELKHKLYLKDLASELKKINNYKRPYKAIYIISAQQTKLDPQKVSEITDDNSQKIIVIQPSMVEKVPLVKKCCKEIGFSETLEIVYDNIDKALMLYGNDRQQYQGFYWCNYEHEVNKKQTYPCEGDFVCQLYHLLRCALPTSLSILSEVCTPSCLNRIDLAIISKNEEWCIPIDIKMNWDQFKHKYDQKTGDLKKAEATLIIDRFLNLSSKYKIIKPIIVVIQAHLAQESDKKERSMSIFKNARIKFDLICYNESKFQVTKQSLGK